MKRFIINIAVISVVLAVTGWLIFSQFIPQYYLPVFPFLLLFFVATSVSVHAYQLKLAKGDIARFTRSNMIITFLKLVLYSSVAIIYMAADRENAKAFVICFLSLYLIFTIFEVLSLIGITNSKKKV
jgi:hypothetical protein